MADRTALVTGASSGIGAATAHALAEEGMDLVLLARREADLREVAETVEDEYGVEAAVHPGNVREEGTAAAAVEATVDRFGSLDVLVCNAGLARGEQVAELSTEAYRTMQETNVDGTFFFAREAIPHLVETDGNLVFVGSFAGQYPRPFNPVYAATKWWVRGFAHSLSAQVGPQGVGVTVVNPTEVRTEFGSAYGESYAERFEPGEVVEPEEVADAIRFAATQRSATVEEIDVYRRDKFEGW